jgi:hypothetical protein
MSSTLCDATLSSSTAGILWFEVGCLKKSIIDNLIIARWENLRCTVYAELHTEQSLILSIYVTAGK